MRNRAHAGDGHVGAVVIGLQHGQGTRIGDDEGGSPAGAAQEQLGRELLERIDTLADLRSEIEVGIRELDAGMGRELDIEDVIRQARDEHAKRI